MRAPLLLEIGCEEIPARIISSAADDLRSRVEAILDEAGLGHGRAVAWGGSRRLSVTVESVEGRQADREETVLGPAAKVAFGADGAPTAAAVGFARKQGIEATSLARIRTEKGEYAAFRRTVGGKALGEILAGSLPAAVAAMSFPKTMRWGDGRFRWVRPVHWLLALHGRERLPLQVFGVTAESTSRGHRFLAPGPIAVGEPAEYAGALRAAFVIADPSERRSALERSLAEAARGEGAEVVEDRALLDEVADLVEWPGVVVGRFRSEYLDLPREILVTTLRHHQKAFSMQSGGSLLPTFLAVANTDRDPAGHVRRGNEWVVGGRLEDARFFWQEDRKRTLAARLPELDGIVFHKRAGSYAGKVRRVGAIAAALAERLGMDGSETAVARRAAELCKADLVTDLVGEFPELQGQVGGLLLEAEGGDLLLARAIYDHYKPVGPADAVPRDAVGCVVAAADKLDTVASLIEAGERPTGSRDPFALRRAATGVFRIVEERRWSLSLNDLLHPTGDDAAVAAFLGERFLGFLRERGYAPNEIRFVLRPAVSATEYRDWPIDQVLDRLRVAEGARGRSDFEQLVDLTKRIYNIVPQAGDLVTGATSKGWSPHPAAYEDYDDPAPEGRFLRARVAEYARRIEEASRARDFHGILDRLAELREPVARFFEKVLVVDPERPNDTYHRREMLLRLGGILTRHFDVRELAGQAERRP